jgi:16S rRNA (cytosine1402-N4)-methyltransferase
VTGYAGAHQQEELEEITFSEEILAELQQLQHDIASRKQTLKDMGVSLSNQKKDLTVASCNKRMNSLHAQGAKYREKREARCRDRVHVSVQLHDAVQYLTALGPDKLYIDCTFGRGGHTSAILSKISNIGRVKAFDVDPLAVQVGKQLEQEDMRFQIFHAPFGDLENLITQPVGGVLLDLGVSSPQLDDSSRGFSVKCRKDGPLDLRMNQEVGIPASEWLQTVSAKELAWVINRTCYRLESPVSERLAELILQRQRENGPYRHTSALVKVLDEFNISLQDEHHNLGLAHIVFVAIRVFLNREEEQLTKVLEAIFQKLEFCGRCVIVCFNRWEVAVLRRFIRDHEEPGDHAKSLLANETLIKLYPLLSSRKDFIVRRVIQPLCPSAEELAQNPRAKSSLHVLEKMPRTSAALYCATHDGKSESPL